MDPLKIYFLFKMGFSIAMLVSQRVVKLEIFPNFPGFQINLFKNHTTQLKISGTHM